MMRASRLAHQRTPRAKRTNILRRATLRELLGVARGGEARLSRPASRGGVGDAPGIQRGKRFSTLTAKRGESRASLGDDGRALSDATAGVHVESIELGERVGEDRAGVCRAGEVREMTRRTRWTGTRWTTRRMRGGRIGNGDVRTADRGDVGRPGRRVGRVEAEDLAVDGGAARLRARLDEGSERDENRLRGVLVLAVGALLARHLAESIEGEARVARGVGEARGDDRALASRAGGGTRAGGRCRGGGWFGEESRDHLVRLRDEGARDGARGAVSGEPRFESRAGAESRRGTTTRARRTRRCTHRGRGFVLRSGDETIAWADAGASFALARRHRECARGGVRGASGGRACGIFRRTGHD